MALDLSLRSASSEVLDLSCKKLAPRTSLADESRHKMLTPDTRHKNTERGVSFQLPQTTSTNVRTVTSIAPSVRKITSYCVLRKQRLERKRKQSLEDSSCSSSEEGDSPPAKRIHDTISEECEQEKSSLCHNIEIVQPLPRDPRDWSRLNVCQWLRQMRTYHIDMLDDLQEEKFPTNGKGLCLMTAAMFSWRVPRGGALLYRDFHLRLHRALSRLPSKA